MAGERFLFQNECKKFSLLLFILFSVILNILVINSITNNIYKIRLFKTSQTNFDLVKNNNNEKETFKVSRDSSRSGEKTRVILLWGFNYLANDAGLSEEISMVQYHCGDHQCNLTSDRGYLTHSHVIVFNPRETQGENPFIF